MTGEVSPLGHGDEVASPGELRASHEDRDRVADLLTLLTKPGIVVDADDVAVSSGGVKVRAPWGTDVPVILRIEVTGRVRSGHLRARPPRRTFWQWLLRRPHPYQPAAP